MPDNITDTPKSNRKFVYVFIALLCILLTVAIVLLSLPHDRITLNQAMGLLEDGQFDEALEKLAEVKEYDEQTSCQFYIAYVEGLCNEADFYSAINACSELPEAVRLAIPDDVISDTINLAKYKRAEYYLSDDDPVKAYEEYCLLGNYEDSAEKAQVVLAENKEVFYYKALAQFESNNIYEAENLLMLLGDYEESEAYLSQIEFLKPFQGTFHAKMSKSSKFIIKGKRITSYTEYGSSTDDLSLCSIGDVTYLYKKSEDLVRLYHYNQSEDVVETQYVSLINGDQVDVTNLDAYWAQYIRDSDSTELLSKPSIGMTADEVEQSTWGKPPKNQQNYL